MPTKFRFITDRLPAIRFSANSQQPSPTDDSSSVAVAEPPALHADSLPPRSVPYESSQIEPITEAVEDVVPGQGLHGVLKATDYWFNLELSKLERDTVTSAALHAQAGLPRQDAPVSEELEPEGVLRARATELYLEWSERVKRKVQDAIHAASIKATGSLLELRHAFDQLEVADKKVEAVETELRSRREEDAGKDRTFQYGSLMGRKKYFVVIALLVFIDWVANVPVFQQLLPQEPGAEKSWLEMVDQAGRYGIWSGFYRAFAHIIFSPEVSLLALGVVIVLMCLGHVAGSSGRRIVAFRPKDETTVVFGLISHRRQAWCSFIAGVLGVSMVLGFLCYSRGKLAEVTVARRNEAQHSLESIQAQFDASVSAKSLDQVEALGQKRADAQELLATRTEGANYAQSVSGLNLGIFLLNLSVVIVAAVGAYLESNAVVSEARLDDPGIAALETKLAAYRAEVVALRQAIRSSYGDIQSSIARARYLSQCFPLRHWEAKARRLEAVIPLFRTENARQRGIDVHNILAFQQPHNLGLPALQVSEQFEVPAELDACEQDFSHLRTQMSAFGIQR